MKGRYAGVSMSILWDHSARSTGGKTRLTARHFDFSPDTASRWVRAYARGGVGALEPKNRRPRRVLLAREEIFLSAKSIDRVIARLKARGVLREAVRPRKATR